MPLNPTKLYTILEIVDIEPNMVATKSKLKIPTNPQFKAPIITRIRAVMSNVFSFDIDIFGILINNGFEPPPPTFVLL